VRLGSNPGDLPATPASALLQSSGCSAGLAGSRRATPLARRERDRFPPLTWSLIFSSVVGCLRCRSGPNPHGPEGDSAGLPGSRPNASCTSGSPAPLRAACSAVRTWPLGHEHR